MVGDDPYPEIEDVHSSRIEEDQVWLEEDQSQPETRYPTLYPRQGEINPGIPKLSYLWTSSNLFLLKI